MTQGVRAYWSTAWILRQERCHHLIDGSRPERFSRRRDKNLRRVPSREKCWSPRVEITPECPLCGDSEGNNPFFVSLSYYPECSLSHAQVVHPQPHQFAHAKSCCIEDLHHRPVPKGHRILSIRPLDQVLENLFHLSPPHHSGQRTRRGRRAQASCDVALRVTRSNKPRAKALEGRDFPSKRCAGNAGLGL